MACNCLYALHAHFFRSVVLTREVGQIDFVLICDEGSLVGACMQDYKSLCAAVTVYAVAVPWLHPDRHTQTQVDNILKTFIYQISSGS